MNYQELAQELEEKLDLKDVSQEVKEDVITHIGDSILERTMLAIAEALTEDEATLAKKHLEEGNIELFLNLLSEKHPELDGTVVQISQDVIAEFVEASKE